MTALRQDVACGFPVRRCSIRSRSNWLGWTVSGDGVSGDEPSSTTGSILEYSVSKVSRNSCQRCSLARSQQACLAKSTKADLGWEERHPNNGHAKSKVKMQNLSSRDFIGCVSFKVKIDQKPDSSSGAAA